MASLYESSDFSGHVDALRAHLFGNIKGDMRCLPPTEDAFQLHLQSPASVGLYVSEHTCLSQPTLWQPAWRELVSGKLVATKHLIALNWKKSFSAYNKNLD